MGKGCSKWNTPTGGLDLRVDTYFVPNYACEWGAKLTHELQQTREKHLDMQILLSRTSVLLTKSQGNYPLTSFNSTTESQCRH
ncbi:hypothetical protein TSMEX_004442 [Taenia solium]|eukprot:TsM_000299700 transcript=TsM_000299700 gene=TsM_000299700